MARTSAFPVSGTDVDRIVAVVLDHADAVQAEAESAGGLSRTGLADLASLRSAATTLGVRYGAAAESPPVEAGADLRGVPVRIAESDEGKYEATA